MIDEASSSATVASAGPRYFGFVTGGALPVAVAVSWLLAAWDQNAALPVMSPAGARLDDIALRWVIELPGLPAGTGGGFVTGATTASASAVCAAAPSHLGRPRRVEAGRQPQNTPIESVRRPADRTQVTPQLRRRWAARRVATGVCSPPSVMALSATFRALSRDPA
jgi:glutamate/tyrosine decarboxylase-like PLP-dependent enzyme